MKDTDLKHVSLKTAFLLALASGKCHSEIHAWAANKVSNLSQWEKVALFPSNFIAKNKLAREGSQSVSLVAIPALATIVDKQFIEDRTLCPVRALRYYLDRTKDLGGLDPYFSFPLRKDTPQTSDPLLSHLGQNKPFYFVINKQTNKPWTWSKLKCMTLGPLRPQAFYSWVSVDQIMQACHWKAHNTFTNFYLKDLTWSDNDNNMYLGSVVVA